MRSFGLRPSSLAGLPLTSLPARRRRQRRAAFEFLERRVLLTNYTVSNTNYSGAGSLGAAITAAMTAPITSALIRFDLPTNSTITLDASDVDTITAYGPTAYVVSGTGVDITIDGSGAPGLTIDGSNAVRLFAVANSASLEIDDVTLSDGLAQGFAGGGGELGGGGGGGAGLGGALFNDGASVTAEGVTFTGNEALGGTGGNAIGSSSAIGGGGGGLAGAGASGENGGAGGFSGGGVGGASGASGGSGGFAGGAGGGGGDSAGSAGWGGVGGFGGGGGGGGAGTKSGIGGTGGFGGGTGGTGGTDLGGGGAGGAGLGGGIFCNGGSLTLINDSFTGNKAVGGTGGLGSHTGGAGGGFGGAVFAVNGTVNATFVTFSSNIALTGAGDALDGTDVYVLGDESDVGLNGGGVLNGTFIDDILGQSSAPTGDFVEDSINGGAVLLKAQYDLVSNNNPSVGTGLPTGPTILTANPDLGALVANGGPTPTMAVLPGSPAIGAGITADYPGTSSPISTDQRGYARASAPDLGAYEDTHTAPTVSGVDPNEGPLGGGTTVTISGTGLIGTTSVEFGWNPASIFTVVSDTQVTAESPAGSGLVDITVVTARGPSMTSPADQFTYFAAPAVTGVSPGDGPLAGGTSVTVTGSSFTGATAVDFGSVAANFTVVNDSTITATSPPGALGTVDITVVTPGGTSATSNADQFTYFAAPAVTDVSPGAGPLGGGISVTVTGSSFTGATAVDFGSVAASFTVVNDSTITATSPPGALGTVDITVVTPGGTSATSNADQFTYVAVPAVSGVSPGAGPLAGGISVTVTGSSFTGATAVDFGSVAASFTVVNDTTITANSPPGAPGTVDVTVVTPGGTSTTLDADQFTYLAVPAVTGISPGAGPLAGGTSVTITGSSFTGATAVDFGSVAASFTVVNDSTITATSPPGALGTVDVTVVTPGGTSTTSDADQFTYLAVPSVTGVSPSAGPLAGGISVTITGSSFTGASAVDFGSVAASFSVVNDTTITATSPPGVLGTVDVTVVTPGGTSATSDADQFTYLAVPAVTGISPGAGPLAGGTSVAITGSSFTGATVVDFGSVAASFTVVNDSTITATSPPGALGTVDVTVVTPGGTSATSNADQFTYVAVPAVSGVSPGAGPLAGGISVTVTGSSFTGATAVDFGSVAASFTVVNETTITATSPPGALGTVDVTVVTPGGTSATSDADQFTYLAVPAVTGISPGTGPLPGGTSVTITGSSFTGATAVDFGSVAASFTVVNDTTITANSPPGALGIVDVTVVTPGGTSAKSDADQFTYLAVPAVSGVSPSDGPLAGGTSVTISGSSFTSATAVEFGSVAASFTVVNETTITATSPPGALGTVDVTVVAPGGTSATSNADQFTYVAVPAVSGVSPGAGPLAGGISVTVTGSSFTGATAVDFGSVAASFTVVNDTTITANSPPGAPSTVDVTVVTPGGTSATSDADQFTYLAVPAVTGISPSDGPLAGGTSVTIRGSSFTSATAVDFGSVAANFTVVNDSTITATSPPGALGTVDVTVVAPGGTSATSDADQFTYLAVPAVSGISPSAGPLAGGTSVTITGSSFKGASAVDFGSVAASFTVVNDSTITATSPPGALGTVDVTVVAPGGTSATSDADQFTYLAVPAVSGISPSAGPLAGGTSVTITGSSFTGASAVDFGSVAASFTVVNDSTITATSPPGVLGTVDVTVVTPGGTSATSNADQFTYLAVPAVSGVSPSAGPLAGGISVTVTGSSFTGATAVDFGSVAASFTVANDTTITATSPPGAVGTVDVTVVTPGGTSATSDADQFTYLAVPAVSGISPSAGPLAGATSVTITGSSFTGATAVDFGSVAASFTVVNDTTITATSPPGALGTVDVTVVTPAGTSATSDADQFTYLAVPAVTGISPDAGPLAGGTSVTITGSSFTGATAIDFGSVAASFTVVNDTTITATSPPGALGTVDVTVVTPGGTSATSDADQFTYLAVPAVRGVSPDAGPLAGGTSVTISGSSLTGATAVDFGSVAANFTVVNDTTITANSPPGALGTVDVTVVTAAGTSATSNADQFTYLAVPAVSGVSPSDGPLAGGTSVTISGSSFTSATAVDFGSVAASFTVVNDTTITANSPPGALGTVDVTVVTPGGTSAKSDADQFTYLAVPAVSGVSPSDGPLAGGTSVTISGSSFTSATAVDFGSVAASFTVVNDSTITATSPPGALGTVDVTVVAPGGTSATSDADQFTYLAVPAVSGVSPDAGPLAGGTSVTINGSSFTSATAVDFGSVAASFTVVNDNTITATSPPGVLGTVDVTVVTPGGTSATSDSDQFTYLAVPAVSGVSPSAGPLAGGISVTVTGSSFTGATAVDFGSVAASFTVVNDTTITATSPPGALGTVDVTVVTPGGTSATSDADQFTYLAVPAVSGISPGAGPLAGATSVTITGSSFTGATAVDFGSVAASFTVVNDTTITATSPPGALGTVDVTVVTPAGTSATSDADQFTYLAVPAVRGVSPDAGPLAGGTSVTISGSSLTGATAVDFGSVAANFTVVNDTTITATSPPGVPGTVDVTVVTPAGTSATSDADQFTYLAVPAVSGVSPSDGPLDGGTSATISGSSFTGASAVDFGSVAASFTVVNDTTITATSPPGALGTVDVTVVTPAGTSSTSDADQFTYLAVPAVSGISPGAGPLAGGTSVTISGSSFTGATAVEFGSVAASFTVVNDTTITATSPPGALGTVNVTVVTPGGTSASSNANQFTYLAVPAVSGVSPDVGPLAGGTSVTISGSSFTGATAVDFGSVAANFTVVNGTTITASSPPGALGTVDVTVVTPGGTSATSNADQFTYVAVPAVSGVSPSDGPLAGGTSVTITGSSFTSATAVDFGSVAASFTVVNETTITATSPPGALGTVDVTVVTPGGTSATSDADQFTYLAVPAVTGISPDAGPLAGGTSVTIDGSSFTGATAVDFGSVAASFTVVNDTTITATSPPGALGTVDVTVVTPGGTSATSDADQFTYLAVPAVTGISPDAGPLAGGTSVTITGSSFTGATAVNFGSVAASFTVLNDTTITATSPPGALGTVDVAVVTSGGTSATSLADEFHYLAPTITVDTTALNLGTTTEGTPAAEYGYTVTGADLAADITISAPTGVELSDNAGASWYPSLTLTESDGIVTSTMVQARIAAGALAGPLAGVISNSSAGVGPQDVPVTGMVKVLTSPGSIVGSLAESYYFQSVIFVASFSTAVSAVGPMEPMTGTVAFYAGTTYLGIAPIVASPETVDAADPIISGTSRLTVSSLAVGSYNVTAVYSGDTNYAASSTESATTLEVLQATTGIALSGTFTAQAAALTAVAAATSPGDPPIVGDVSFYMGNTLLATQQLENGVASFVLTSPPQTATSYYAIYNGGGNFLPSLSAQVQSPDIAPIDDPRVTGLKRYGYHNQQTYLIIYFNEPLDPGPAESTLNYTIVGPKKGTAGHQGSTIAVSKAVYDPATDSVTLKPAHRLNVHSRFTLTINGTAPAGLRSSSGTFLDGSGDGNPGSNYVATISWNKLAGPANALPTLRLIKAGRAALARFHGK